MPVRTDDSTPSAPDPRVARAVAGDRAALEQLLMEHLPRIRNLVRYLLRGDSEIDDVSQQAMIEIMRSLPGYSGEGSFKAWLDRITVRAAFHHIRRRKLERKHGDIGPELLLVTGEGEAPDNYSLRREAVRWLDDLPDEQRYAVVLHHILGFSAPELAQELNLPLETVRSRLRLGMDKLRQRLPGQAKS
ncbi:MAG: RNA polymerase sigma factor [Myxococcales bacterium]